jgi:Zn finger protein HypA/HybF involved in hydrogenase expression
MSDDLIIPVSIPLDDEGMLGRECLECKRYFKLKPGTGLPIDYCHCPYCDYEGKSDTFWTSSQIEYAQSIAMNQAINQFIKPSINKLTMTFKELERKTRNSFIQFKFKESRNNFSVPIKYYKEEELETKITCNNCGLVFSIYGVFARCPDCNQLNAFLIYYKSLEVTRKQLKMFSKPEISDDIQEKSLSFLLLSCISVFDGLGKELRMRKPTAFPEKPKNLFQNLLKLNETLNNEISQKHSNYTFLLKMFQVRHLFEHNMGVIDNDFINKIPEFASMAGRKYSLSFDEIDLFIDSMEELGKIVQDSFSIL